MVVYNMNIVNELKDSNSLPALVFSSWVHWAKRAEIPRSNLPGVYLLARFSEPPQEKEADPLSQQIVVIGQTRRSLLGRWTQFHAAAFGPGGNHSEGNRYRKKDYPDAMKRLYVAAMPSSPLQWRDWATQNDENLAKMLRTSLDEARKFKKYIESSASARTKGVFNGAWIMYVERYLLLQFVLKWGKLPECNAE
jgi:hypothetical protein